VTTRAAVAWAVGAYGIDPDPDIAAAVMLAVHDLMGAVYPIGTLDVDALDPSQFAGFDGHEGDVLAAAQVIKADALAHAHLEGTIWLAIDALPVPAGTTGDLVVRMTDAIGQPVAGVGVTLRSEGAALSTSWTITGADGRAHVPFTAAEGWNGFSADATPPDPTLHAFASTAAPAQRVAVPARVPRHAEAGFVIAPPPPPPTTTTTTTTTPTTVPVTTTTSTSTTSTTTTSPSTTSTTTSTTTTVPESTTTLPPTTAAPATTAPSTTIPTTVWTETRGPLPRTGVDSRALSALGATAVLLGALLVHAARRRAAR
jgi:LPXTG-motif cell wall-anchored protein